MAEENGEKKGTGLLDRVRQDVTDIKEVIKEKGKEELEGLKEPEKTQLFRSIFRVKHDETPRNRALSVLSNVSFICIPPRSTAMLSNINIRGEWAGSRSTCSSSSLLPASC